MAFRRRSTRRVTYRRKYVPRTTRKKIVKSYLRRSSRRGGTTAVKMRATMALTTTALGTMNNVFQLTTPNVYDGVTPVQEWSSFALLYDSYRVNAVKLSFIPSHPNDSSVT